MDLSRKPARGPGTSKYHWLPHGGGMGGGIARGGGLQEGGGGTSFCTSVPPLDGRELDSRIWCPSWPWVRSLPSRP